MSGDSHVDRQQSGSWMHERDEGEEEQVLQPKIRRKRSIRLRPRQMVEKLEDTHLRRGDSSSSPFQLDFKHLANQRSDGDTRTLRGRNAMKHDPGDSSKNKRNIPPRKIANTSKPQQSPRAGRLGSLSSSVDDVAEASRESWDGKIFNTNGTSNFGAKMSDVVQRKVCYLSVLRGINMRPNQETY